MIQAGKPEVETTLKTSL